MASRKTYQFELRLKLIRRICQIESIAIAEWSIRLRTIVVNLVALLLTARLLALSAISVIFQAIRSKNNRSPKSNSLSNSFTQKISTLARENIDLTIKQTAKITAASQELINNFGGWSENNSPQSDLSSVDRNNFDFKSKEKLSFYKKIGFRCQLGV